MAQRCRRVFKSRPILAFSSAGNNDVDNAELERLDPGNTCQEIYGTFGGGTLNTCGSLDIEIPGMIAVPLEVGPRALLTALMASMRLCRNELYSDAASDRSTLSCR